MPDTKDEGSRMEVKIRPQGSIFEEIKHAMIPVPLAVEGRPEWNVFPMSIQFGEMGEMDDKPAFASALYYPDGYSYTSNNNESSMIYRPLYGGNSEVDVCYKPKTKSYALGKKVGGKRVQGAFGADWDEVFAGFTNDGLFPGERCRYQTLDDPLDRLNVKEPKLLIDTTEGKTQFFPTNDSGEAHESFCDRVIEESQRRKIPIGGPPALMARFQLLGEIDPATDRDKQAINELIKTYGPDLACFSVHAIVSRTPIMRMCDRWDKGQILSGDRWFGMRILHITYSLNRVYALLLIPANDLLVGSHFGVWQGAGDKDQNHE